MNFRIVDEHGRQLGTGRDLASLKAELGGQARSAFQALAALKVGQQPRRPRRHAPAAEGKPAPARLHRGR
jgi:ATP-dependent helicase HrpA